MTPKSITWPSYLLLVGAGIVLVFTWLGPEPSEGLGLIETAVFWALHVAPALVLLSMAQLAISKSETLAAKSALMQIVCGAILAALMFLPFAIGLDQLFAALYNVQTDEALNLPEVIEELVQIIVPFVCFWLLINAPNLVKLSEVRSERFADVNAADDLIASTPESKSYPEFWEKLPPRLGNTLVSLSAELHYTRVVTTTGNALILYPFGKAVASLDPDIGMQVHRSHWLSFDQIGVVQTIKGNLVCTMTTGWSVPVSRANRSEFRAAFNRFRELSASSPAAPA